MKKRYVVIIVALLLYACKEAYNPPVTSPATGYLVVDGFINSKTNGVSTIVLTHTTRLVDTVAIVYEDGAQVNIEDENNVTYPLYWKGNGTYVSDNLSLNPASKYRLHIRTGDNKEYVSDFATMQQTPPIDSISWQLENGGVQIYVNSHDATDAAKYYQLKYSETWEYHSSYIKYIEYVRDPVTNLVLGVTELPYADTSVYKCWRTQNPTNMILASTEKLSEDKVYLPLRYIEPQATELSILYYIEVKQYALSKDAYLFKQKLKKNTEQLGTIFDAQPSELGGNIHCINAPEEPVIGYVDVTEEQVTHLFIHNSELTDWPAVLPCAEVLFPNDPLKINSSMMPTRVHEKAGLSIASFFAADPICVDCRIRGGTNVRPSFWP